MFELGLPRGGETALAHGLSLLLVPTATLLTAQTLPGETAPLLSLPPVVLLAREQGHRPLVPRLGGCLLQLCIPAPVRFEETLVECSHVSLVLQVLVGLGKYCGRRFREAAFLDADGGQRLLGGRGVTFRVQAGGRLGQGWWRVERVNWARVVVGRQMGQSQWCLPRFFPFRHRIVPCQEPIRQRTLFSEPSRVSVYLRRLYLL